ncbi:bifunctional 3'-5' exonuclease/ATP-dependent helicase WRN-like [Ptychodera flava]|uniref:bifunctional 3'-5' exonuclease/ATP-dependent helicase WRN-like n=1 Tax=Ptychodera flava TaxID=63121 RepID=UPI003969BD06
MVDIDEVVGELFPGIKLKDKQRECLEHIVTRYTDLVAVLPTGYGKSLIYQVLPEILRRKFNKSTASVLVVSPLNVIHIDQIKRLAQLHIKACKLDIGCNMAAGVLTSEDDDYQFQLTTDVELDDIIKGNFDIVFCHPEAILNTKRGHSLLDNVQFQQNVQAVVIDECHTVELWAKDFRRAFALLHTLPTFFRCPVIALSATITVNALGLIPKLLGMVDPYIIKENPDKPNMFLDRCRKQSNIDVYACAGSVFEPELNHLFHAKRSYPVTLIYMPISWMAEAQTYAMDLFANPTLEIVSLVVFFLHKICM